MKAGTVMLVLLVALTCAGCGEESDSGDGAESPAEKQDAAPVEEPSDPGTKALSEAGSPKGEWPLTVSEGTVKCEGSSGSGQVTFEDPDGAVYAVNGTAKGQLPDLPEIDEIWKDDPDIPGAKINISPVLDAGLALCE